MDSNVELAEIWIWEIELFPQILKWVPPKSSSARRIDYQKSDLSSPKILIGEKLGERKEPILAKILKNKGKYIVYEGKICNSGWNVAK